MSAPRLKIKPIAGTGELLRRSELTDAAKETLQFLSVRNVMRSLGFIKTEEAKSQIAAKVCAVDAFMEGIEAHLSNDSDSKMENLLVANSLYVKAMEHINKSGQTELTR